jgi:hypothetical protein
MIEELERLARAAKHAFGHWWHTETLESVLVPHEAAFVSALSPDRVLRLLEVVKQAKRVIADLDRLAETGYDTEAALRAALAGLEEGQ